MQLCAIATEILPLNQFLKRRQPPSWIFSEVKYEVNSDIRPTRSVRKAIFSLRLWRPRYQRRHATRLFKRDQELSRTRPLCTGESGLSVVCVNSRSIGNKAATLCRIITESNVDVMVITETWHEGSQSSALKRLILPGYHCVDAARPILAGAAVNSVEFQNHGGLAIVYRSAVRFLKKDIGVKVPSFEYVCGRGSTRDGQFMLLGVYRPGSQAINAVFFQELSMVFERLSDYSCPVVLCGDFNVHVDDSSSLHAARFADLLQSAGYVQHVNSATHTAGHTLDLVITRSDTDVTGVRVGDFISDHAVVHFTVQVKRPTDEPQLLTRSEWRNLTKTSSRRT